jgi:hypothetical protein
VISIAPIFRALLAAFFLFVSYWDYFSTLKLEVMCSSETSALFPNYMILELRTLHSLLRYVFTLIKIAEKVPWRSTEIVLCINARRILNVGKQGTAQYKRLKLGGGHTYDRSSD